MLAQVPDPFPPDITPYIESIRSTIGADPEAFFVQPSTLVYLYFLTSGDYVRSARPYLEKVINSGVRTVIYDGEAVRRRP